MRKPKAKVGWKPICISLHRFIEPVRCYAVEAGEVRIEENALAPEDKNAALDLIQGDGFGFCHWPGL